MPQSIDAVERQRPRNHELGQDLQRHRPCRKAGRQARALKVQAQRRCDEVCGAVEVEDARDGNTGDTVQRGEVPGDLRAVDGEMGSDGPVQALFGEDVVALLDSCGFGCDLAGGNVLGWDIRENGVGRVC